MIINEKYLNRKYNLTKDRYLAMAEQQNECCSICLVKTALVVDHDHMCCPGDRSCGFCIRGLLCRNCNIAIGLLEDDHRRIARARKYIFSFRESRNMIRTNGNKHDYDLMYPEDSRVKNNLS